MIMLGEVLYLATPQGAIIRKPWLLRVFRLLENALAAIVDLNMLSDTNANIKPHTQSSCTFMQIYFYFANSKL